MGNGERGTGQPLLFIVPSAERDLLLRRGGGPFPVPLSPFPVAVPRSRSPFPIPVVLPGEYDLPEVLVALHRGVGVADGGEGKGGADHRP